MKKCKMHHVLFYEPEVLAIHCMALEYSSLQLALSRSDGTVEVWSVKGTPYLQRVMHAGSVESLAWSKGRLFSAGLHGSVIEFDLLELNTKYTMPLVGGPVWCIGVDEAHTMLAAGTEEGYVNVLDLTVDNAPRPLKLLDKQEGRVLCLAWHPDGKRIVTGSTDCLRLWNVETGRGTHRMTMAQGSRGARTTVWFVAVTKSGEAVAGDSSGVVSFWDLNTGVQTTSVKTHSAPVLAMALSTDHETLFCAGADPLVVCLQRLPASRRWIRAVDRRLHDQDVRAMACADKWLFSGGVDGHVAVSAYPPKTLYKHPPLQHNAVSLSQARFLLLRHTRHVEVWALGAPETDSAITKFGGTTTGSESKHLLNLQSKNAEHITCSAISADAAHIAYATPTATRVVALNVDHDEVSVAGSWGCPGVGGAVVLAFCPVEPHLAIATRSGKVVVMALGGKPTIMAKIDVRRENVMPDALRLLTFSPTGSHLAASDLSGLVTVFSTSDWTQVSKLPQQKTAAMAMCFKEDSLLAVYANHQAVELTLSTNRLSPFSKQLSCVPKRLSGMSTVLRAAWDPKRPSHLLLADETGLYGFSPSSDSDLDQAESKSKKIKKAAKIDVNPSQGKLASIAKFKHVAFADWLGENELVVVETTPTALQRALPPILRKSLYGTK